MRKHTTVTAAAPGVGKSTLTVEEAVSLASGVDFLGFGIDRPKKVAVINNEETRDELERRIEATCTRFAVWALSSYSPTTSPCRADEHSPASHRQAKIAAR
jgi:RecA-family ATPase